jgi:hypothetical protein
LICGGQGPDDKCGFKMCGMMGSVGECHGALTCGAVPCSP